MATTTNYGWDTPDDTDLVKDGAAAIRTLGSSIDTTLKAQIDAQIPDALLTTTGDTIYASAASTPARLAIGTSGQVLAVNGSGLPAWTTLTTGGTNWSLLNTGGTALTGATTVTVSGISGKDQIMLVVDGASAGASSTISVRFNTDTGNNYTFGAQPAFGVTPPSAGSIVSAYDRIPLGDLSNNAASVLRGWLLISGCNSSGLKIANFSASGTAGGGTGQTGSSSFAMYSGSSTISSVSIHSSSGNLDAGTLFVYTSA